MSETLEHHPSERELALSAHQRRKAFHRDIEAKAAALRHPADIICQGATWDSVAPPPAAVLPDAVDAPVAEIPIHIEGAIRKIQNIICENLRVRRCELLSSRRERRVVMARQVGMFLAKENTSASLPEIGRRFGGRDHSTVLHAVRRVRAMVETAHGTGISTQWKAPECDMVRSYVALFRAFLGTDANP